MVLQFPKQIVIQDLSSSIFTRYRTNIVLDLKINLEDHRDFHLGFATAIKLITDMIIQWGDFEESLVTNIPNPIYEYLKSASIPAFFTEENVNALELYFGPDINSDGKDINRAAARLKHTLLCLQTVLDPIYLEAIAARGWHTLIVGSAEPSSLIYRNNILLVKNSVIYDVVSGLPHGWIVPYIAAQFMNIIPKK